MPEHFVLAKSRIAQHAPKTPKHVQYFVLRNMFHLTIIVLTYEKRAAASFGPQAKTFVLRLFVSVTTKNVPRPFALDVWHMIVVVPAESSRNATVPVMLGQTTTCRHCVKFCLDL